MFRIPKNFMNWRWHATGWRRRVRANAPLQILLILAFWQAGEAIVHLAGLPLPGAIAGLFLLLALLMSKHFSPHALRRGAQWFLAELLLFLVPSVLSLLDHPEFLGLTGLKILAAILLGTLLVMVVTALVVDLCYRWLLATKGDSYAAR